MTTKSNIQQLVKAELLEAQQLLDQFLSDQAQIQKIESAAQLISEAFAGGQKLLSCGNGGSHCDAMHLAEELSGKFRNNRKALPALAISEPAYMTCVGNDFGFESIFSRQVEALGKPGDILFALSTSGNSANIIKAIKSAREQDMKVIALTGKDGGKMAGMADVEIRVPHFGYADRIQEIHIKVIHILILLIEKFLDLD